MGEEIQHPAFSADDFAKFRRMLDDESRLLRQWFDEEAFENTHPVAGSELEVWLVDEKGDPAPRNVECLNELDSALVSPELSRFNIELNLDAMPLRGRVLTAMRDDMQARWKTLAEVAGHYGARCVCIGILPTARRDKLTLGYMSPMNRYYALNEQIFAQREGRPMEVDIAGRDHLRLEHSSVMLESAATSFQIHIQTPQSQAARYINASMIVSAPLVAVSANSPYLFGRDLWSETRVPVFEQAVCAEALRGASGHEPLKRVTFGSGYARQSLWEFFEENLNDYPVLLPQLSSKVLRDLAHLRLQNGTIWRWNRPLIGFNESGVPHLRIEQRVAAAGPTIGDMIANAAFYYGVVESLAHAERPPEECVTFTVAREDFYRAAKSGLAAKARWLDGKEYPMKELILDHLLEMASQGLARLGLDDKDARKWLRVIERRTRKEQTGSDWQRWYVRHHGDNMHGLLQAYYERQESDKPVHEWDY